MSGNIAQELNARLFIEGRSVPFEGVTTSHKIGQPGTATIQVPPLPEIKRIKPRTMIQIFVKDFSAPSGSKPWVLLFEGEAYGYSQGKSTSSRSFSIYAMDYSNYWDNAKQFYMNLRTNYGDINRVIQANGVKKSVAEEGISTTIINSSIKSYLTTIISKKLSEGGEKADFLEAVVEILRKVEEVNPFFRYNQYRYRISDRMLFNSSQNLTELFDFINKDNVWESITGSGNGGLLSVRQIVNKLMGLIFHEFVSIPCPSKVDKELTNGIGPSDKQTIGSFLFKPDTFMMPPPKCNVIYPDMYSSISFSRNFFNEVTRFKIKPALTTAARVGGVLKEARDTYYSPSGYETFMSSEKSDQVGGEQFQPEVDQGSVGDDISDSETTSSAQEFNFLSREEILKGIFPEMGGTIPSAQALMSLMVKDKRDSFFRQATNYLFYKKRLASRSASGRGPLNLAPVPGFSTLFIDDSDAEQNVIGVLQGITHNINTQGGATTSYNISYARDVDEEDLWSTDISEPPVPSWYDPQIFGKVRKVKEEDYKSLSKANTEKMKRFEFVTGFEGTTLSNYYKSFLGNTDNTSHLGSEPIVSDKFPNVYAATLGIIQAYRTAKSKREEKGFIKTQTRRDYVLLEENFRFLGATIGQNLKGVNFLNKADIVFSGEIFDGGFVGKASDKETVRDKEMRDLFGTEATQKRREPIDIYRKRLLTERGFRG